MKGSIESRKRLNTEGFSNCMHVEMFYVKSECVVQCW